MCTSDRTKIKCVPMLKGQHKTNSLCLTHIRIFQAKNASEDASHNGSPNIMSSLDIQFYMGNRNIQLFKLHKNDTTTQNRLKNKSYNFQAFLYFSYILILSPSLRKSVFECPSNVASINLPELHLVICK